MAPSVSCASRVRRQVAMSHLAHGAHCSGSAGPSAAAPLAKQAAACGAPNPHWCTCVVLYSPRARRPPPWRTTPVSAWRRRWWAGGCAAWPGSGRGPPSPARSNPRSRRNQRTLRGAIITTYTSLHKQTCRCAGRAKVDQDIPSRYTRCALCVLLMRPVTCSANIGTPGLARTRGVDNRQVRGVSVGVLQRVEDVGGPVEGHEHGAGHLSAVGGAEQAGHVARGDLRVMGIAGSGRREGHEATLLLLYAYSKDAHGTQGWHADG